MNYMNYPQQTQPQPMPQQYYPQFYTPQTRRKVDLVQGHTAAEVYPVNAGEEIILIDMDDEPKVYRKARGFDNKLEPMETYSLVKEETKQPDPIDTSVFVTDEKLKEHIDNEVTRIIQEEVEKRISEISFTPKRKSKASED